MNLEQVDNSAQQSFSAKICDENRCKLNTTHQLNIIKNANRTVGYEIP